MFFFALNMKICKILQFTIQPYNSQSHLPLMILRRIPILTILTSTATTFNKGIQSYPNNGTHQIFLFCWINTNFQPTAFNNGIQSCPNSGTHQFFYFFLHKQQFLLTEEPENSS